MFDDLLPPPITDADPNAFAALHASISRVQRIRHFLALDLAEHVAQLLKERKKTRRWLARRLGKSDSELSKWLNGTHNLTLESIAKLTDVFEEDLFVSTRFPMGFFGSRITSRPSTMTGLFDEVETMRPQASDLQAVRPLFSVFRAATTHPKTKATQMDCT